MTHVYRNRSDDRRPLDELHYCSSCDGWYGVPHGGSHCQTGSTARWRPEACACRFCCEATGRPVQGASGYFVGEPTP